jgi:integrase
MKAQYRFIFARKGLDYKGMGLIQLVVYLDRKTKPMVSTGERIYQDQWDPKKHLIKPLDDHLIKKQERLNQMIRDIEDYEMDLIRKKEQLTAEKVREFFRKKGGNTFNSFIEDHLKAEKVLKYGTTKGHWVMLRKLNAFNPDIKLHQVNYSLVYSFNQHLHTLGLSANTIADHHKVLRRYIKLAISKTLIEPGQDPYAGKFKPKREPTARAFLSDDEVLAIEQIDYSASEKYEKIRDMFLFCCWTGLRFSDMQNLQKKHLQKNKDGWEILLHRMIKVPQPVFIPMHILFGGKAQRILELYHGDDDYIFPRISGQKANDYLKVVVGAAKITKRITWHSSRHYFGSALAWRFNDPLMIMQLMGHSELKTSMIYIHQSQEMMKNKLRKIEW